MHIYIYIYFFFFYYYYCDWRSMSASITRGEFDLFIGPSAATYYYNCTYTYDVYGTISYAAICV